MSAATTTTTLPPADAQVAGERAAVLTAARDGRAWEAIERAGRYLLPVPGDAGVRYVLARCLADVGLPAAASAALGGLTDTAKATPEVVQLRSRVASDSGRHEGVRQRTDRVAAALDALGDEAADLRAEFGAWCDRESAWIQEVAADGNVLRRPCDDPGPGGWVGLHDARSAAQLVMSSHTASAFGGSTLPVLLDGVRPPWLLLALGEVSPWLPGGFRTRVRVVEPDVFAVLDALAMADVKPALARLAVEMYTGRDATRRLSGALVATPELVTVGAMLETPGGSGTPGLADVAARSVARVRLEEDRLISLAEAKVRGRDAAYWAERYARALKPGSTEPLRVLVVTCLYTTYVRHAAMDLADGFRANGCVAEVLLEPDRSSTLSRASCCKVIDRLDPDLVVMINYTRSTISTPVPKSIPFVCWIQDQMPHLYQENCGAAQDAFDFVIGYTRRLLFDRFGYAPERAMFTPVVASAAKFRAGPIDDSLRARLACDVAYVSNQSQTPERLHEQILGETTDAATRAIAEAIFPVIGRAVHTMAERPMLPPLRAELEATIRRVTGAEALEQQLDRFIMQYVYRIGELFARHEMLHWAAEACARRGWSLKLFGAGWEEHPTLSAYAAGPLEHGNELRACYAVAGVHLHASVSNLVHQRVLECAFSGGVTLCRSLADIRPSVAGALRRLGIRPGAAFARDGSRIGFSPVDDATLAAAVSEWQRLGWADELVGARGLVWCELAALETLWERDTLDDSDWWCHRELFGEVDRFTFRDAAELESRLDGVLTDGSVLAGLNAMVVERAQRGFSSESLAAQTVRFVADSLSGECSRSARPR